jgi:hypothetical protein
LFYAKVADQNDIQHGRMIVGAGVVGVKSSILPQKSVVHYEQKDTGFIEQNWTDYVMAGGTVISTDSPPPVMRIGYRILIVKH